MNVATPPRWIISGAPRPAAPKLYCFAHGGGSAAEYLRWARELRAAELHAVQLPGRGSRIAEPPLTSMDALVAAFTAEVVLPGEPYAFLGHSLGALVAYEIARTLRTADRPLPARLIVSGCPAPHLPRENAGVRLLPDPELLDVVARSHGGIPEEVLASEELSALMAATLRADYTVLETYSWRPSEKLDTPLTVLGGDDDHVTAEQLEAWGELTTGEVTVRRFPGGHFYLRERPAVVLRAVAGALAGLRVRPAAPC